MYNWLTLWPKTELRQLTQNVGSTIKSHEYANLCFHHHSILAQNWFRFFLIIIHLISISRSIKNI